MLKKIFLTISLMTTLSAEARPLYEVLYRLGCRLDPNCTIGGTFKTIERVEENEKHDKVLSEILGQEEFVGFNSLSDEEQQKMLQNLSPDKKALLIDHILSGQDN